jgi:hypothetical protein
VIPASGHNNLAMNRSVLQATRQYVDGGWWTADGTNLSEGILNQVGAVSACMTAAWRVSNSDLQRVYPRARILSMRALLFRHPNYGDARS